MVIFYHSRSGKQSEDGVEKTAGKEQLLFPIIISETEEGKNKGKTEWLYRCRLHMKQITSNLLITGVKNHCIC